MTKEIKETTKVSRIETSKIMSCNCQSQYQDEYYGFGKRLHITSYKANEIRGHNCTVCGEFKKQL